MEDVLNLENIYPYQRRIAGRTKLRPEGKAPPLSQGLDDCTLPPLPPLFEGLDPLLLTLFLLCSL